MSNGCGLDFLCTLTITEALRKDWLAFVAPRNSMGNGRGIQSPSMSDTSKFKLVTMAGKSQKGQYSMAE